MNAHRIRLRRPWQREVAEQAVRWRRRFHRPTGLQSHQRVLLVVEGLAAEGRATLNGRELGPLASDASPCRFDVSQRLEANNELVLELDVSPPVGATPTDAPPAQVALEIS